MRPVHEFALVTTSVADRAAAEAMARALVEARLAACVQITAVDSVYRWNEALETSAEYVLVAKIRAADAAEVEAAILCAHSYELPEIVVTSIIGGSAAYLDWIAAQTTR